MRWDRLFADLEARAEGEDLDERDVLVSELLDGEWSGTGWNDLLDGAVVLDVAGLGRVEGVVRLATPTLVRLDVGTHTLVVDLGAVRGLVTDGSRRPAEIGPVTGRLGWGHVMRALAVDDAEVRVHRTDGAVLDGRVDVVGRDFVRLDAGGGRPVVVPFAAVAAIRSR
ncbi:hypothetical protein [Aeromicrobium marinum]|uniref:hypothetical protein n=1 Tax=Aeromicrobium marinum TaxID=219314 RepID=UPI0006804CD7|nr:hypothetical protein [Aeromicrobium marinum]